MHIYREQVILIMFMNVINQYITGTCVRATTGHLASLARREQPCLDDEHVLVTTNHERKKKTLINFLKC